MYIAHQQLFNDLTARSNNIRIGYLRTPLEGYMLKHVNDHILPISILSDI